MAEAEANAAADEEDVEAPVGGSDLREGSVEEAERGASALMRVCEQDRGSTRPGLRRGLVIA